MRKYQPIWNQLKETKQASIEAPISSHARIIQAVKKEKWRDMGWKLLLSEKGTKYILYKQIEGSVINFYLQDSSPINTNTL